MFQGGPLHEPYFIAIDNREQVIIDPSKKIVTIYVVGELVIMVWFMGTWMLKWEYYYNWCFQDAACVKIVDGGLYFIFSFHFILFFFFIFLLIFYF